MASSHTTDEISLWFATPKALQDAVVVEIGNLLGKDYLHLSTHSYSDEVSLRIPTFQHCPTGLEFNLVFGGTFQMGIRPDQEAELLDQSDDLISVEVVVSRMQPAHWVAVPSFLIARFPLTTAFAGKHLALSAEVTRLVTGNLKQGASVYLTRGEAESAMAHFDFAFPSEAQWEYACRGGTQTLFYFGDQIPDDSVLERQVLLDEFSNPNANLIASNAFGLVGLSVGEWCLDSFYDDRRNFSADDTPVAGGPPYVIRGGALLTWPWQGGSEWLACLSAYRDRSDRYDRLIGESTWAVRPIKRLQFSLLDVLATVVNGSGGGTRDDREASG